MDNQTYRTMILLICLVSVGMCRASEETKKTIPFKSSSVEIGPEIFSHKYEEFLYGATAMKEQGTFYGLIVNSSKHSWVTESPEEPSYLNRWMSAFEGEFAFGQLEYNGQLQDGTPYEMSGIKDLLVNARILGGFDFVREDALLTPYFGLGYRYLRDDSSSDPAGYLRQSNYIYLPLGIKLESYKKGWSIGGSAEFDLLLLGIHLTEINGIGFKNNQRSGYGFNVGIDIINRSENLIIKLRPFYRYWNVSDSDIETELGITFMEPENKTSQFGVQFVFQY